jgi:hypothetical protein
MDGLILSLGAICSRDIVQNATDKIVSRRNRRVIGVASMPKHTPRYSTLLLTIGSIVAYISLRSFAQWIEKYHRRRGSFFFSQRMVVSSM